MGTSLAFWSGGWLLCSCLALWDGSSLAKCQGLYGLKCLSEVTQGSTSHKSNRERERMKAREGVMKGDEKEGVLLANSAH